MAKKIHKLTLESPSGIEFKIKVIQNGDRLQIAIGKNEELPNDVSLPDLRKQIIKLYGGGLEA